MSKVRTEDKISKIKNIKFDIRIRRSSDTSLRSELKYKYIKKSHNIYDNFLFIYKWDFFFVIYNLYI